MNRRAFLRSGIWAATSGCASYALLPPPAVRAFHSFLEPPLALIDELHPRDAPSSHQQRRAEATRSGEQFPFTMLTWNVQRGEQSFEQHLDALLDEHDPAILLLQEAPERFVAHELLAGRDAHYAPFHLVLEPSSRYDETSYGQVTATSAQLHDPVVKELPTVATPDLPGSVLKRIALAGSIATTAGMLRIANLHLEPWAWPRERLPQYRALLDLDADLLAGDYNSWLGPERETGYHTLIAACYERAGTGYTRDDCFARGLAVHWQPLERKGSDHTPVLLTINRQ